MCLVRETEVEEVPSYSAFLPLPGSYCGQVYDFTLPQY